MSDDPAGASQLLQPIYQDIDFDGDTLPSAIVEGDGVLVPIRKICESLGLDPKYQLQRLRDPVQWRSAHQQRPAIAPGAKRHQLALWLDASTRAHHPGQSSQPIRRRRRLKSIHVFTAMR